MKNRDIWDEDEGSLGLLQQLPEASPTPTQDRGAFTPLCLAFFSHPYALRAQVDFDSRPAPWAATHTLFRTLSRAEQLDAVPELLVQVNLSSRKSIISAQRWQNTCLSCDAPAPPPPDRSHSFPTLLQPRSATAPALSQSHPAPTQPGHSVFPSLLPQAQCWAWATPHTAVTVSVPGREGLR